MRPQDVEILLLRPDEVLVDREHLVQRNFRIHHARKISADYSPALASAHVSARSDGKFYVCDGQHTCAAAIMASKGDIPIPMRVHRGLSIKDEAALFIELNAHKLNTHAFDRFCVGVTAGHATNLDIVRVLESFGLTYGQNHTEGTVAAVDALVQIYEGRVRLAGIKPADVSTKLPQAHLLSRTLHVLTRAWGRERSAFDGILMRGVAALFYKHGAALDGDRLARSLGKYETPVRAIGKIRALSDASKISGVSAAVQFFEGVYNRKLSGDRRLQ